MPCPSCATEVPADARFCPNCGANLHVPADERRVVTVVFGDLVGFTALAEQLDPEQVKNLVDRCFARLADDIDSFGGRVDKIVGDALVALFGAPVAHEDDAERAVRAALQMQRTLAESVASLGVDIRMRIGVNTGEVLVGAIRAGGDYTAMGDVVNTASRLQTLAEPGTVVVGPDTHLATAGVFRYEPLGLLDARGRQGKVEAWRAGEPLVGPGGRPPRRLTNRLVGRDVEATLLGSFVDNAVAHRRPSLLVLVGEAGIGKSRLAEEVVLGAIASHQARVLSGRAVPYGAANLWWPIAELVRSACGIEAGDAPDDAREKCDATVRATMTTDGDEAARVVEALLYLIGVGTSLAEVDIKRAQDEVSRAVRTFIEALAAQQPVVVVISDVHWADPSVLVGVDDMLQRLHRVPVVVLLTARPELERAWRSSSTVENLLVLNLDPLSDAAAEELLSTLLGAAPDPAIQAQLVERAGGNPLFLEELAAVLSARDERSVGALPATLRGIVAARLDTLPPVERAVLDAAAIIGRRAPLAALIAVGGGGGGVAAAVDELVAKDLLVVEGGEAEFRSDLVREVVYGTLTKAERARRHVTLAGWLEATHAVAPDEVLRELARHWATAADLGAELGGVDGVPGDVEERAIEALRRAGQRAEDRELYAEARRAFDQLARIVDRRVGDVPSADRRHALIGRAVAAAGLHDLVAAEADAERAEREARAVGDDVALARALAVRGEVGRNRAEFDESLRCFEESRDVWRRIGSRQGEASALRHIGWTRLYAGDLPGAEAATLEALAAFREAGPPRGEAWALQNLAWVASAQEDTETAEQRVQESIALFGEIGDFGGMVWAASMLGWIRFSQGRMAEAEAIVVQARADAEEQADRWQVAMLTVLLARIRLWHGRIDDAISLGEEAMSVFDDIGDELGQAQATAPLIRALVLGGRFADAARLREEAATRVEARPGLASFQGSPTLAAASTAVAVGQPEEALSALIDEPTTSDAARVGLLTIRGLAELQLGHVDAAVRSLEEAAASGDADAVMSHALALAAAGRLAEATERAAAGVATADASYRVRALADLVQAVVAARGGDPAGARAALDAAARLVSTTSDRVTGTVVAVARAAVLAAVGDPFAAGAEAESTDALGRLGVEATGWRHLFEVATGVTATPG